MHTHLGLQKLHLGMASLVLLPNELKDMVLEHLPSPDLIRLATTCKALYDVALPWVYRNMTLTWANADDQHQRQRSPDLFNLLQTLKASPDIAKSVRTLNFEAEGWLLPNPNRYPPMIVSIPGLRTAKKLKLEDESFLFDEIQHLGLSRTNLDSESDDWETGVWEEAVILNDQFFVLMFLIIAQCVRLESLSLSIAFLVNNNGAEPHSIHDCLHELIPSGIAASNPSASWMSNLRTVRLTCESSGLDRPNKGVTQIALYVFYLPRLETLEIANLVEPVDEWDFEISDEEDWTAFFWPMPGSEPPVARSLTTLRLPRSRITFETLAMLLRQTPNLEILEYEDDESGTSETLELVKLRAALDQVQSTLTHFSIRIDVGSDPDRVWADPADHSAAMLSDSIGSFRDYIALTHLNISLHVLLGSEDSSHDISLAAVLPPNLQFLTISDDLYGFVEFQGRFEDAAVMSIFRHFLGEVRAVGGQWKTATPYLKRFVYDLRIRGHLSQEYWGKEAVREEFKSMCEGQGLEGKVLWKNVGSDA